MRRADLGRAVFFTVASFLVAATACGIDAIGTAPFGLADAGGGEGDGDPTSEADVVLGDGSTDEPAPDATFDADAGVVDADADADVFVVGPSFCQEASLIACYRFEGSVVDESAPAVGAPTTSTNVTFVPGLPAHGSALRHQPTTVLQLPDDPSWDSTNITVEFWVKLQTLPLAGTRGGIFDNSRAYAVFIQPNGAARCGTANLDSPALPLDTWTHVACVWNAANTTVTVYVNGAATASVSSPSNMPIASTEPAAIGSNIPSGDPLDGLIDGLRIFGSVRSAAQIAAAAQMK